MHSGHSLISTFPIVCTEQDWLCFHCLFNLLGLGYSELIPCVPFYCSIRALLGEAKDYGLMAQCKNMTFIFCTEYYGLELNCPL